MLLLFGCLQSSNVQLSTHSNDTYWRGRLAGYYGSWCDLHKEADADSWKANASRLAKLRPCPSSRIDCVSRPRRCVSTNWNGQVDWRASAQEDGKPPREVRRSWMRLWRYGGVNQPRQNLYSFPGWTLLIRGYELGWRARRLMTRSQLISFAVWTGLLGFVFTRCLCAFCSWS